MNKNQIKLAEYEAIDIIVCKSTFTDTVAEDL